MSQTWKAKFFDTRMVWWQVWSWLWSSPSNLTFHLAARWVLRYTCVPHPEPSSLLPPHSNTAGRFFTDWATGSPRKWRPTPVFWPGGPHGQRSLEGCSPCGGKEWDTTEETKCVHGKAHTYHGLQGCCMIQPLPDRKTASRLSSLWFCCSPSSLSASWGQLNFSHLGYFYCHFLHQESLSSSSSTKWLILTL